VLSRINISDMTEDAGPHSEPSPEAERSSGELVGIRAVTN